MGEDQLNEEMLAKFYRLGQQKKEIDSVLNELKKQFHQYFDGTVGKNVKGEVTIGEYKIQRQVRTTEKYNEEKTVEKLAALNLEDLMVKKPDAGKIKSAIDLGILPESALEDCRLTTISPAITVKPIS